MRRPSRLVRTRRGADRAGPRPLAGGAAVYRGTAAIDAYYRDVCGRNIEHRVTDRSHRGRVAYVQHCRYPDGGTVICVTVARLEDGRIVAQTAAQVWD